MGLAAKIKYAEALNRLLESRKLSEISVVMLAKESGLARRTFYDNFSDIYEFQMWVHEYLTKGVIEDFWKELPFDQVLLKQLKIMEHYHGYYRQLIREDSPNAFCGSFISSNVARSCQYLSVKAEDEMRFIIETYTAGAANQIYQWIERNMPIPPEALCRLLILSMPEPLKQAYPHEK